MTDERLPRTRAAFMIGPTGIEREEFEGALLEAMNLEGVSPNSMLSLSYRIRLSMGEISKAARRLVAERPSIPGTR
jgi:hypothetical protein